MGFKHEGFVRGAGVGFKLLGEGTGVSTTLLELSAVGVELLGEGIGFLIPMCSSLVYMSSSTEISSPGAESNTLVTSSAFAAVESFCGSEIHDFSVSPP